MTPSRTETLFSTARRVAAIAAALVLSAPGALCWSAPDVVVTIKPVHSLAAAVLEGVTKPKLLLEGAASPHAYSLKPSDAQALAEAGVIVRVSENLEVFLDKAIATLPGDARVIEIESAPGLTLLPARTIGADLRDAPGDHPHDHGAIDVHVWLDPINAIKIAEYLAEQFAELDPAHAPRYRANAGALKAKLEALNAELKARFAGLSGRPFIVFHDVTQYLEKRYGLNGLGAVTLSPERAPGAKRLSEIRKKIEQADAICVFSEPQFPPKLVETLVDGTGAKQGVLDEIGANLPAGPDHYFALLRADAESLAACLRR
jgi:zinc transport system substrate-binding protein